MKLWTLMDDTAREGFVSEHGLSLYLETENCRLLFDFGQTGAFAENARLLGIDLAGVDAAVLSHGHYDHGGGLTRFLELNHRAPVYVSRDAFGPHYNAKSRFNGLRPELAVSPRLRFCADVQPVAPGITVYTCRDLPTVYPVGSCGLQRLEGGRLIPDDFRHEQYLLIEEKDRRTVISGCSHRGVGNILRWLRPDVLIGGFHTLNLPPDSEALARFGRLLAGSGCSFYTCHCTGQPQFDRLKEILGQKLIPLRAGSTVSPDRAAE